MQSGRKTTKVPLILRCTDKLSALSTVVKHAEDIHCPNSGEGGRRLPQEDPSPVLAGHTTIYGRLPVKTVRLLLAPPSHHVKQIHTQAFAKGRPVNHWTSDNGDTMCSQDSVLPTYVIPNDIISQINKLSYLTLPIFPGRSCSKDCNTFSLDHSVIRH